MKGLYPDHLIVIFVSEISSCLMNCLQSTLTTYCYGLLQALTLHFPCSEDDGSVYGFRCVIVYC